MLSLQRSNHSVPVHHLTPWFARPVPVVTAMPRHGSQGTVGHQRSVSPPMTPEEEEDYMDQEDIVTENSSSELEQSFYEQENHHHHHPHLSVSQSANGQKSVFRNRYPPVFRKKPNNINNNHNNLCDDLDLPSGWLNLHFLLNCLFTKITSIFTRITYQAPAEKVVISFASGVRSRQQTTFKNCKQNTLQHHHIWPRV